MAFSHKTHSRRLHNECLSLGYGRLILSLQHAKIYLKWELPQDLVTWPDTTLNAEGCYHFLFLLMVVFFFKYTLQNWTEQMKIVWCLNLTSISPDSFLCKCMAINCFPLEYKIFNKCFYLLWKNPKEQEKEK